MHTKKRKTEYNGGRSRGTGMKVCFVVVLHGYRSSKSGLSWVQFGHHVP
jgi:hypothetical protein